MLNNKFYFEFKKKTLKIQDFFHFTLKKNYNYCCKDIICSQSPEERSIAQKAQNNKFVKSRLEIKISMSQVSNDHNRIVVIRKHKTNSFGQGKSFLTKSEEGCSHISLLNLIKITILECTVFYSRLSNDPFVMGFFFFIFPFLTSSQPFTCRSDCWL